jgi:organic radical activating enzyme
MADELQALTAPALLLRDGNLLACVTAQGSLFDRLTAALVKLRQVSSRESVRQIGLDRGFRLEDATAAELRLPAEDDAAFARAFLLRRLPREASLQIAPGDFSLAVSFAGRIGGAPARHRYELEGSRLRVEAFELHVTEHCNLRCANCCNMSPLVPEKFLSVEETRALCERMSRVLIADVFKIMGGEPLLHPDIAGVLRAVRSTSIGERVRLFTNGLLLPSMPEAFWEALDELTISDYTSAKLKPAVLELAARQSARHGFVLNVKPVNEFSQVLSPHFRQETQQTFERCWLRHRCLIVRGGRFYMCTRAAYAADFLAHAAHEAAPGDLDRSGDGIALDAPDLLATLEQYLNRKQPLGACHYCYGSDGAVEPHYQLKRSEVREGVLSRALTVLRG